MLALLVIYQTPRGGQEPKGFGCCRGVLVHMSLYYWNSVGPVVADLLGWYAFSKAGPKNVFQLQVDGTNLCATQLYPKVPGHRIQGGCNKSETWLSVRNDETSHCWLERRVWPNCLYVFYAR